MPADVVKHEEPSADGRRRKGQQRRRLILEATMRMIEREGVAGVTQRAVAKEAGIPPSAVMYYFPTIGQLLHAALAACNDSYIDRLRQIPAGDQALDELASLIADAGAGNRAQTAAEYELFLLAAREPDLRPEINRWWQAVDSCLTDLVADPVQRQGVAAAVDGLFVHCLCAQNPPGAAEIRNILRQLVAPQ